MYYECCVCKSSRQDVILHHFPCNQKRIAVWLKCLKRDDLQSLSYKQLSKLFVCQKHFEKRFITTKSRLIGSAYPSLFTEDEILSGIATLQNTDVKSSTSLDHDYYIPIREHNDHTYTALSDDHQLTSTLSTANDGNVTDNRQMALISDRANDGNVTDNQQMVSISDRANDGNVTDNHQMASISDTANEENVTDNHQMPSISDTANEENVTDIHQMPSISDTANEENVIDDHEMTSISDTANDENVTDDYEMTSISYTANDENLTVISDDYEMTSIACTANEENLTGSSPIAELGFGFPVFIQALELHTELVESGKELPQLREFFSNPGNFEQHVSRASEFSSMHRTPSQATLDSLDTARYSEDGGGDRGGSGGDVAVLEFELRKARETINSLRANLTQFADGESTLDKSVKDLSNQRSLKPHEKRALNFLINEYLLLQDYKLTSITFSDENPDQEFEDWDDVGLNMPRPAGLVSLFRGNTSSISPSKVDASTEMDWSYTEVDCQTDLDEGNICISFQRLDQETDWSHELLIQAEEIELLKQKIIALETEKLNFQKLYDAAIVSLNSLTSPASEGKGLDLHIPQDKLLSVQKVEPDLEGNPITCMAAENHYGSGNSTHSATPEQFEMIDSEKNSAITRKGSNISSFEATGEGVIGDNSTRDSPLRRGSVTTLDETLSINDAGEWTRVQYEYNSIETNSKEMWIDSGIPNQLKVSILNWCCETLNLNEPLANDLLAELVSSDKPITLPGLLTLVADTLPRILPHTLVARRGEAVALLAAAAGLLPAGDVRRARALHALLTLLKRPDAAGTRAICEATCLVVKWGGSGEVLSSIAELLASKSIERRVLASQVCMAIAPYVPIELCTSLLLSLVILMCESNELEIRTLGLKSACLICPVADHKYSQIESLMFNFLKDPVEKCVKDTVNIFVPVLARSALIAGKFSTELCSRIMKNLIEASSDNEWKTVLLYLEVMRVLVLAKLAYVVNVQIVRDVTLSNCDMQSVNLQEVPLEDTEYFMELQCYVTDNVDAKILLVAANNIIKEKPEVRWPELSWFISTLKQILDVVINTKVLSHTLMYEVLISLVNGYVENFGLQFTKYILKPIFTDVITELEQKMEKLHPVYADTTILVGIYLVAILPALDDPIQHCEFLQKWIMYSIIRGLPVKIFSVPLKWVAEHREDSLDFYLQHLREFAASSCETTSGASVRIYIANLITDLLNATELTEKCIERQMLPAVMALLHDEDVSVREEAISSWGSVTRTCLIRGLDCEAQCWAPVEDMLGGNQALTVKEAARTAEALALLVLPTVDNHAVSEKAVSLLCSACGGPLSRELLSSLTPGLQLAVHHCRHHPALLPALRKLEEGVQAPALSQYKAAIEALIHNVAGTGSLSELAREHTPRGNTNLQAAQEVGRRVTQMFQQSKSNMNLQNIFKKKT